MLTASSRRADAPAKGLLMAAPQPLNVEDLNIYYGDFRAVADVDVQILPRSVTALIGPSGCGKSTFLRTLNRMHEVIPGAYAQGTVEINGEDIYDPRVDPVNVRRRVGMVFQKANPFPTMSIRDNVLAGVKLNNRRMAKSAQEELLERSLKGANLWNEVKDRLDKPGMGLSGGQQQRLRSEEHTSELQSRGHLVCRLLLEKKNK